MQRLNLEVLPRGSEEAIGKKTPLQLRKAGWVPGVLYGHGKPEPIQIEIRHLKQRIHTKAGVNALFNVKLGEETALSVIKDIQRDIFSHDPIHVDLFRINLKEKLELTIPTHSIGEANGVKNQGGVLEHIQRDLRIRCLPDDIPASIDVDISNLDVHQSITVKDLKLPSGVEVLTAGDHIVFHVVVPRIEEEPVAPIEGATATEPEVISKGKKEEEGAAAEGAAAAPAAKGEEKKK